MNKLKYANGNMTLTEDEKVKMITEAARYYGKYMTALGFDWQNDPNSIDTPMRVARAFINDLARGVYNDPPKITAFDNMDQYDGIVFQGNIKMQSICSHHHLPFIGFAHVSYIPSINGKVIGLSKINRIVEFYARRPQVQENLTMQIHNHMDKVCADNDGVAVMIEANHMCTCIRGVEHDTMMKTAKLSGSFFDSNQARNEFYGFIGNSK